jgi:hypothetical protein
MLHLPHPLALQASPAVRRAVLQDAGFPTLEALEEEVEARRGCCAAKALPVVVQAIQDMCTRWGRGGHGGLLGRGLSMAEGGGECSQVGQAIQDMCTRWGKPGKGRSCWRGPTTLHLNAWVS